MAKSIYMTIGASHTAGMVVVALIALMLAHQSEQQKCYDLSISLTNNMDRSAPSGSVMLNTDGTWTIRSWALVDEMAKQSWAPDIQCVASELLAHRHEITVNNHNRAECPMTWPRPLKSNAIIRKCRWLFNPMESKEARFSHQFPATRAAREG